MRPPRRRPPRPKPKPQWFDFPFALLIASSALAVAFLSELPIGWSYSIGLPIAVVTCTLLRGEPGFDSVLWFSIVSLGICAVTGLFDIHGLFCLALLLFVMLVIGAVVLTPIILIAKWWRGDFNASNFDDDRHFDDRRHFDDDRPDSDQKTSRRRRPLASLLPLALIPLAIVEAAFRSPDPIVTHTTERALEQPLQTAWSNLRFYDELDHDPPLIFHLGLPRPIRTTGELAPGAVQRCFYDKGSLRKVCTELEAHRTIAFAVLDQNIGFERSVALQGGSFQTAPLTDDRTKLTVTTEYTARLRPRWLYEPVEAYVVGSLHEYLIEGVEEQRNDEKSLRVAHRDRDGH